MSEGRDLYIADLHFSHKGILRSRPYADVEEMDRALLGAWREAVRPEDRVYILGDLFAYRRDPEPILRELTGRLVLVVGNHDPLWLRRVEWRRWFRGVCEALVVLDGDRRLALTHAPRRELLTGGVDYLLYGHLHANPWHSPLWEEWLRWEPWALNVGVDIALAVGESPAPAPLEAWVDRNLRFRDRV